MTAPTLNDLQQSAPDAHIWAQNIIDAKKIKDRHMPAGVDLAGVITRIDINASWQGTDNIVMQVLDEDWKILDSGFFDLDADGKLDLVDVNYPDGSRFWWRMTQCSPQGDFTWQLTFIDRIPALLDQLTGPVKTNRASRTRAEFLQELASKMTDGGGIDFHSLELDIVQAIAGSTVAVSSRSGVAQAGTAGAAGGFWEVPASVESDPIGTSSSFGHITTHMAYSVLSKSGTSSDAATAGQAISPFLGAGERMIFVNPANSRSAIAVIQDRGAGSDAILPVVGVYSDLQAALQWDGSGPVRIKRANGQPMTCARGHLV